MRLSGVYPFWPCPGAYSSCRFTGATNFVDSLQSIYGLPAATNYSIGGARTDNTNTLSPTYLSAGYGFFPTAGTAGNPGPSEIQTFAATGTRFTDRDLIVLSIGGNDLSAIDFAGLTTDAQKHALIVSSATTSAMNAVAGVEQLAGSRARNIAWLSTGSSKWFPQPPEGAASTTFSVPQRDAWANTYYQQTQQLLEPLAQSGVRIFLFDFGILQERVSADPAGTASPAPPIARSRPFSRAAGRECDFPVLLRELGPPLRRGDGANRGLHGQPDRCAKHRGSSGQH